MISSLILLAASGAVPSDAAIASRIKGYMADPVKFDHFSGAVLVTRHGKVILRKGYGLADSARPTLNQPTTRFRIGSVSKQFTAAAIMQLVDRDKLRLDDPISKYIADSPPYWEGITVEHLLNHTSGLVNYTALPEASGPFLKVAHTHEDVLKLFRDRTLESKPGKVYSYNNSGYFLLGMIVERCSGESFASYLRKNIFTPLALKDTDDAPARALSYRTTDGVFTPSDPVHPSNLFAIGGLSSTVDDLNRWQKALLAGKVVSKASLARMLTPGKGDYGFGWIIDRIGGQRRYYHDGGVADFSTSLQVLPDAGITVIAISNRGDDGGIRVAYDTIGWICGTPATLRGIQPEIMREPAEASFKRIEAAKRKFPIFDCREEKIKELGNYLVISGQKTQAIELFKLNTMLFPKSADAHYRLALNYSWAKKFALSRASVEKALELDPRNSEAQRLKRSLRDQLDQSQSHPR